MRRVITVLLASVPLLSTPARSVEPETEDQKIVYALGFATAKGLAQFDLRPDEIPHLLAGLSDHLDGRPPRIPLNDYNRKIRDFAQARYTALAEKRKAIAGELLEKAAAEPGAVRTESGLVYREVKAGDGASPGASDVVRVHYHGTLHDGTVFDSSKMRGEPAQFPLDRVIPCWTEALQRMKVGGEAVITCPAEIAYQDQGQGDIIPPWSALRFEVELLGIE